MSARRDCGVLEPSDIQFLRSIFEAILIKKGVPPGSTPANELADGIINLYLAGVTDEEELRDALTTSRGP